MTPPRVRLLAARRPPRGLGGAALASAGMHVLAVALLVGGAILMPRARPREPEMPPQIELVLGAGPATNGAAASQPAPKEPTPPQQAQPQPVIPQPPPSDQAGDAPPPGPAPPAPAPATEAPEVRLGADASAPNVRIDDPDHQRFLEASPEAGNVAPIYPVEAAWKHEEGTVVVMLAIDPQGHVERADVVESSGSPRLDRAARDRLLTWHFHPAMQAGQPVPSTIEQTIKFKLTM